MTKTEKRNAITSALCKHITKHYPELEIGESEDGRLEIYNQELSVDDSIEYHRSRFSFCTLNWADENMKRVELELQAFVDSLTKQYEIQ
jgi:hypothetical protein